MDNVNYTKASARPTPATQFKLEPDSGIPATPPSEVLSELDQVQRVAAQLREKGLDIRFDWTGGRDVAAQVIDASGKVVREIPVAEALSLLTGELPATDIKA
jgi:hypothetical protein